MGIPLIVLKMFEQVEPTIAERGEWHGPYDSLFCVLFPSNKGYQVYPLPEQQHIEGTGVLNQVLTFYIKKFVRDRFVPILALEVKAWKDLSNDVDRKNADVHMRQRLNNPRFRALEEPAVPKLYGLSAMGHSIAVYSREKSTGDINPAERHGHTDAAPSEWWDCDLLSPEGQHRFKEIVREVKKMAKNL